MKNKRQRFQKIRHEDDQQQGKESLVNIIEKNLKQKVIGW